MTNAPVSAGAIAKPVLKGLHNSSIRSNIIKATILGAITYVIYKTTVVDPRRETYAEFYKNYDTQKSFEKMKAAGIFQSC